MGGLCGAGAARAHTQAQQSGAGIGHHGAHIGEVNIHQARPGDDVADALHAHAQHVVGGAEGVLQRCPGDRLAQAVVGDHDQGVDMLGQASDPFFGLTHAPATFKAEGLGDNANGESAAFLGDLGHYRSRAGACAAAHAGGNEHQISTLERLRQIAARFFSSLLADGWVAARPKTSGQLLAELNPLLGSRLQQGLGIGVEHAVAHTLQIGSDHAVHSIAAATTHADHLNPG